MEAIPSPRLGFLRGVVPANHLASTDNLTRTTKRQNTYNKNKKKVPNKQQHNKKKHAKIWQTEPGLVAFYDIQPGNEAGLSLQLRSPHGAHTEVGLLLAHRNNIGWMSFLPPSVIHVVPAGVEPSLAGHCTSADDADAFIAQFSITINSNVCPHIRVPNMLMRESYADVIGIFNSEARYFRNGSCTA